MFNGNTLQITEARGATKNHGSKLFLKFIGRSTGKVGGVEENISHVFKRVQKPLVLPQIIGGDRRRVWGLPCEEARRHPSCYRTVPSYGQPRWQPGVPGLCAPSPVDRLW